MGQRITRAWFATFLILSFLLALPMFGQLAFAPTPAGSPTLIDVHNHLPRGVTLDQLIEWMDKAGVQMTVLMPVFYEGDKPQGQGIKDENLIIEFYNKRPDRIIPFLGMQRQLLTNVTRWEQPDEEVEKFLRFVESQLQTGLFKGVGEFILRHYPYSIGGTVGGTLKIPADTPLMRRFLDLAAKYRVPITIHYEIDDESLPSLKRMLEYGRNTTIILAHNGGRSDPTTWKGLLDDYPNLFYDLGGMTRVGLYGVTSGEYKKNPIDDGTSHLRPEWKTLCEQYADRLVGVGTDLAHPELWVDFRRPYMDSLNAFRSLLSDLSVQTAGKIAFMNAQKIFLSREPARTTSVATTTTQATTPPPVEMQLVIPSVVVTIAAIGAALFLRNRKKKS